jgi:hypothetical protein
MNLMWLCEKITDLTKVCMLFNELLTHHISDATFEKW